MVEPLALVRALKQVVLERVVQDVRQREPDLGRRAREVQVGELARLASVRGDERVKRLREPASLESQRRAGAERRSTARTIKGGSSLRLYAGVLGGKLL